MITDPGVLTDATNTFNPCTNAGTKGGIWTFGHLIREMANTPATGVTPEDFLKNWLNTWTVPQTVNGDIITPRPQIAQILLNWQTLCGTGNPLDVDKAPFKLIAIVNRLDLGGSSAYGFKNPGEGRFVFCAINDDCTVMRNPQPFMVIFEYGIPKSKCVDLKAYAQEWYDLKLLPLGLPAYNNALGAITKQFTEANLAPSKPNGNALNQIRTNELGLGVGPWELREFNIDAISHQLIDTTVKQEPQIPFNNEHFAKNPADVQDMATFVNNNEPQFLSVTYSIPLTVPLSSKPFLAGKAHTLDPSNYHWDGTTTAGPSFINSDSARFQLSLNTCSGCHGGEANTGNFMHVAPSIPNGVPAQLSGFITGNPPFSASPFKVQDRANRPSGSPQVRGFNDLERRGLFLEAAIKKSCSPKVLLPDLVAALTFKPLNMVH